MDQAFNAHEKPSSSTQVQKLKKEEPEDDFTSEMPGLKKQKTTNEPHGRVTKTNSGNSLRDELQMYWEPIQVRSCINNFWVNFCVMSSLSKLTHTEICIACYNDVTSIWR